MDDLYRGVLLFVLNRRNCNRIKFALYVTGARLAYDAGKWLYEAVAET